MRSFLNENDKLEEIYEKMLKEEKIKEGFFGDIQGIIKLGKQISEIGKKIEKEKYQEGKEDEFAATVNDLIEQAQRLIEGSKISDNAKQYFMDGFFGSVYGVIKKSLPGKSDKEIKEMFQWPRGIIAIMKKNA